MLQQSINDPAKAEGWSIPMLEADRVKKEHALTEDILEFNRRVNTQVDALERDVMYEITALNIELGKEEVRRGEYDQKLLGQVNAYLDGLQQSEE